MVQMSRLSAGLLTDDGGCWSWRSCSYDSSRRSSLETVPIN